MYDPTRSSGCVDARLNSQVSRGRNHSIASGSTPASSNQLHVSIAVLPAPSTVNPAAGASRSTRSFGGISRTPASTVNGGTWRDGIDDSM